MKLLDTNVVSEMRKISMGRTDPTFAGWARADNANQQFVSVITLHELHFGVLRLQKRDPGQAFFLEQWLSGQVMTLYRDRTLSVDAAVAMRCAELLVDRTHSWKDALIGATAYVHGMTLVTRNITHFQDMGIRLLNPWAPPDT